MDLLNWSLAGQTATQLLIAVSITTLTFVVTLIIRNVARRRLTRLASRTPTIWDDVLSSMVGHIHPLTLLAIAVWVGSYALTLPERSAALVASAAVLIVIAQTAASGNRALDTALRHYRADDTLNGGRKTMLSAIGFMGRLVLYTLLALVALENVGVNVTALLAGIGLASVAIGLALQNVLTDLFASLSIVFDRPFEIGDFVIVGSDMGTVEHVGLRTTRMRALGGEELIFGNSDLLSSRIRNYKRMEERRVVLRLGVTYDTTVQQLRAVPSILQEAVERHDDVRFDRAHFDAFADFALEFELVYWMLSSDYAEHMDRKEAILLEVAERFEALGIEFAFPTQTVHVLQPSSGPDAGESQAT
jgi:small-conductance mechanosensitive channel